MAKSVIGIVIIGVVIILGLQIDDDLDARVVELLEKAEVKSESEAYFYLMGIYASEQDDPVLVGRKMYRSILRSDEAYQSQDTAFEVEEYPEEQRLPLPQGDLFCRAWEKSCLSGLFQQWEHIENLLDSNAVLLNRYKTFIEYDDFATLTRPMITEPFPRYQYITRASRLVVLSSIKEARASNYARAMALLADNIKGLRKQFALQDTLVGKMIFLLQIAENLDVACLISREAGTGYLFKVPELTREEKDFTMLIARELGLVYNMFTDLDGNPEFWEMKGNVPAWIVKMVFKPNISINSIFPVYRQAIEYASLSHAEFTEKMHAGSTPVIQESRLRNLVGVMLNRAAVPNYNKYIARMYDLDAKIALFNSLTHETDMETRIGHIRNPYYKNDQTAYLSEENQGICFDGPLPDEKNLRCLPIKL